jgi:hypothetical protein
MSTIDEAIENLRREPEGPLDAGLETMSSVGGPALVGEIERAWPRHELPRDAIALWRICRRAHLYEDVDYGQWGLILLDPKTSARTTAHEIKTRRRDFRKDDLVIGSFLGDQELVVIAPSETGNRRILVALEMDERKDWYGVGAHLGEFLGNYFQARGEKYWAVHSG